MRYGNLVENPRRCTTTFVVLPIKAYFSPTYGSGLIISIDHGSGSLLYCGYPPFQSGAQSEQNPVKGEPYECGVPTIGQNWVQFNVGYYLFALIFLIFDVELIFLYPWAVSVQRLGMFAFTEAVIFLFILFMGFLYAHKKGALKWM